MEGNYNGQCNRKQNQLTWNCIPEALAPAANYVPFVISGKYVYVSGQVSSDKNGFICGKLGSSMKVEDGYKAARQCGLALLAQLKSACSGDLSKVNRVLKLTGFVNCTADFTDQPKVINGASDLMVEFLNIKENMLGLPLEQYPYLWG